MPDKKTCFVIAPIGKPGTDIRIRSDKVLTHVIERAAAPYDYHITRADKISESGMITAQIIDRLRSDDLVVADLTGPNANVFYELAIRHCVHKPFILLIEKDQPPSFDVAAYRAIEVDIDDIDSAADAAKECSLQMKAIIDGQDVSSPVSASIALEAMRGGPDPGDQIAARVAEGLDGVRQDLRDYGVILGNQSSVLREQSSLIDRLIAMVNTRDAHPSRVSAPTTATSPIDNVAHGIGDPDHFLHALQQLVTDGFAARSPSDEAPPPSASPPPDAPPPGVVF